MKKIFIFLIGLMILVSLNSCETYTYATTQDDIYVEADVDVVRSNVSFDVIIRYGTPYYMDGALLYYLYKDLYYYPFYYNNYWYVRAYRRPFTHFDRRPYFRPHRYDYRFSPGQYRGFNKGGVIHHRPHPNTRHVRPNVNRRTDIQPRQPRPDVRGRGNGQPRINGGNHSQRPQTRPNVRTTPRGNTGNHNGHFGGRR